jgi:hypothetical protein
VGLGASFDAFANGDSLNRAVKYREVRERQGETEGNLKKNAIFRGKRFASTLNSITL